MLSSISENLKRIQYNIEEARVKYGRENDKITLMAVTKTVPADKINFAFGQGVHLLGENRVQEYLEKKDLYNPDAEVHFIGHLQSNKVRFLINDVKMIHSVDSLKLAAEINRHAEINNLKMDILAEVNVGNEDSKSGLKTEEVIDFACRASEMKNIQLRGLMVIPPKNDSERYFEMAYKLYDDMKSAGINNTNIDILSMGMSSDYVEAIKHGSNIVRIGSGIFGARK